MKCEMEIEDLFDRNIMDLVMGMDNGKYILSIDSIEHMTYEIRYKGVVEIIEEFCNKIELIYDNERCCIVYSDDKGIIYKHDICLSLKERLLLRLYEKGGRFR